MNPHIKSLHVENVGTFDKLDVKFADSVNIIIGANGAGKTSLLKCICYCFSLSGLEYIRRRKGAGYWATLVTAESKQFNVGAASTTDIDEDYRHRSGFKRGWQAPSTFEGNKSLTPVDEISYNLLAIGANRYFDYSRIDGMQREAVGTKRRQYYRDENINFLEKVSLPNIKQWMINRYFVVEKDWAGVEAFNWRYILAKLPEISPVNSQLHFSKIERDLEPIFEINNRECYLEELSSGFKSFLAIVFSIVDWCEGVNENDDALIQNATGTVLIDEIDNHLHPEWQAKVVKSIKSVFPRLQFIVTTHSPLVLAAAESGQVIKIPAHNGTVSIEPEQRNYKGWQLDYILADLMGFVNQEELSAKDLFADINIAYEEKNLDKYKVELQKLKATLNSKDPMIQYYQIKLSNLLLNTKND